MFGVWVWVCSRLLTVIVCCLDTCGFCYYFILIDGFFGGLDVRLLFAVVLVLFAVWFLLSVGLVWCRLDLSALCGVEVCLWWVLLVIYGSGELPLVDVCLFICYSFVLRELLLCYVSYGVYCCYCVLGLIA